MHLAFWAGVRGILRDLRGARGNGQGRRERAGNRAVCWGRKKPTGTARGPSIPDTTAAAAMIHGGQCGRRTAGRAGGGEPSIAPSNRGSADPLRVATPRPTLPTIAKPTANRNAAVACAHARRHGGGRGRSNRAILGKKRLSLASHRGATIQAASPAAESSMQPSSSTAQRATGLDRAEPSTGRLLQEGRKPRARTAIIPTP